MRAITLLCLLAVPAFAQTPTQPSSQQTAPTPAPVPLPQWFVEIDTAKKGEVSRADFVKYRMKLFDELDANKDGKLSLDEFLKVAEPPFSGDAPGGLNLEERRSRARSEFQTIDTNRDGFVERAEIEAVINAEFNQYDTDRDNKVTEPEVRLIVQRSLQRQAAERQQIEARRRQGMLALSDFIDMQLLEGDKLDKNNDGKISQQEYLVVAGPADGAQAKDLLPYDIRRQLVLRKFQEIDTNKDGQIDRVELTAHAVKRFLEMDLNKDRFLDEDELKKAQEADAAKMREMIPKLQPQPPAAPRPAPPQPTPAPGPPPGLPQKTR
jgi:Ca2+-binding EF-hand superfamily protein